MSKSSRERLYSAITNIDDKHIEEAQNTRFIKKKVNYRLISGLSAAAVFVLVVAGAINANRQDLLEDQIMTNDSVVEESVNDDVYTGEGSFDIMEDAADMECDDAAENSTVFTSYSDLILPLTLVEDDDNITASRDITFDFDKNASEGAVITDSYTLTNTSDTDKKITVLYPFVGESRDMSDNTPNITLNGSELKAKVNVKSTSKTEEWEEYRGALDDGAASVVDSVVYLESEIITIPAGGSVTVSAKIIKKQSLEYDTFAYDLVTDLGSNLIFTEQNAVFIGNDNVELLDQNFGFDVDNDVYDVKLDMNEDHYYLQVKS